MPCDQCNIVNINGVNCHETGCPIGPIVATCFCGEQLTRRNIYYANDWDGIIYCKDCAERQAEYENSQENDDQF